MSTNTTAPSVSTPVSTAPVAVDWTKELANRRDRTKLPRFHTEVEILMSLAPKGASDETATKAVDFVRGELAKAAKTADGKQDFAKAGKLGKDGKRALTLDKAKIEVTETLASRLVAVKCDMEKWAKSIGCKLEEVPFPPTCELRTTVEGLFANYGWKRP